MESRTPGSTTEGFVTWSRESFACALSMAHMAPWFLAQARLATPLSTSHCSIESARSAALSDPSSTIPKPPFMTSPQPTPPPLWRLTHVAPLTASPMKFCTAMSAVNLEPSLILDVSLYGLSVPETSWWSLPRMTGAEMRPVDTASLNLLAISLLPSPSA